MMAATVAISFLAVVFRYGVGSSLSWSFEASIALLTHMTFVGAFLALRRGAHLRIDVLVRKLPVRTQGAFFVFNQLVIAAVGAVMLYWGSVQAWRFAGRETIVMELPLWLIYPIIPLCGLGILIEALFRIPGGVRRVRANLPPESDDEGFSLGGRDTGL